jgi:long-subunit acyl-CoA synthetase (AMP-forming)
MTESYLQANPDLDTDEALSYLPLAHIYENPISSSRPSGPAGTVNFVESMDTLPTT